MYWIPIILTLFYLCLTIFIFAFGPIIFSIYRPFEFYAFLFLYVTSIGFGYVIGRSASQRISTKPFATIDQVPKNKALFAWFVIGGLCSSYISLHLDSFFSMFDFKFLVNSIVVGLSDPGSLYATKMEKFRQAESNKIVSASIFILAPFKILFISAFLAFWPKIKSIKRIIGLLVVFIAYLLPALLTGTNKPLFDLFIYFSVSMMAIMLLDIKKGKKRAVRRMRIAIIAVVLLSLLAFSYFSLTTSSRGGKSTYIETTSRMNDIAVRPSFRDGESTIKEFYVWFTSYIVQGYYGLSLAMQEDFSTTYGFGGSIFLARQVYDFLGIDLPSRTYQRKISPNWDENAQWHSFFSYIANDVHFFGVIFVCMLVGFFLAIIWHTYLRDCNYWSFLMLPLLALLVIFMPANNQVFNLPETFSSFFFVLFGWLSSIRIKKN